MAAMKVLTATLALLVSSAAAAQECQMCSMADACIKTYLKAASEAQRATKEAIRDWKQNLDRKASTEFSSRARPHYNPPRSRKFVWSLSV
jgi:hypothetical protein